MVQAVFNDKSIFTKQVVLYNTSMSVSSTPKSYKTCDDEDVVVRNMAKTIVEKIVDQALVRVVKPDKKDGIYFNKI